jgi:hypothetical protein
MLVFSMQTEGDHSLEKSIGIKNESNSTTTHDSVGTIDGVMVGERVGVIEGLLKRKREFQC